MQADAGRIRRRQGMAQMRLDRFLAEEGVGTRSEVKKLVRSGRVRVNGTEVRQPEYKIDPEKDSIEAEGRAIGQTGFLYLMMNKPGGVLSATRDGRTQTVISLVQESWANKLFPAGRLDQLWKERSASALFQSGRAVLSCPHGRSYP